MARVDREVVRERLERAVHEAEIITARRVNEVGVFCDPANDNERYELEHRLFVAIQAVLDVASHIAVVEGYRPLASYRDAMEALLRLRVIGSDLRDFAEGAPGLRNKLAHEYLDVDCSQIFEAVRRVGDVQRFAAAVWDWVISRG